MQLATFELTVTRDGEEVLSSPIAYGTEDTPTPGGRYFITELLQPPDPDGVYGTFAFGLSGFSDVLLSFAGGEGVIGIHGTNDPASDCCRWGRRWRSAVDVARRRSRHVSRRSSTCSKCAKQHGVTATRRRRGPGPATAPAA